jgi:hypothetical protein
VSPAAPRFAAQAAELARLRERWRSQGELRELSLPASGDGGEGWPRWPRGRRLVLAADAALDLGTPAAGSRAFVLWSPAAASAPAAHRVAWRGPDLGELVAQGHAEVGLGLVIHVRVAEPEPAPAPDADADADASPGRVEYERYLDLQDALYSLTLDGITLRSMPSQQHLWLRLHRDAVARGVSLAHLGAAVVAALAPVEGFAQVDVLLVTAGPAARAELTPVAEAVQRRVAALVKRHEERLAECDECDYADVCDEREHESW